MTLSTGSGESIVNTVPACLLPRRTSYLDFLGLKNYNSWKVHFCSELLVTLAFSSMSGILTPNHCCPAGDLTIRTTTGAQSHLPQANPADYIAHLARYIIAGKRKDKRGRRQKGETGAY